jgi:polyribonucleotide nucleotidyltransferase
MSEISFKEQTLEIPVGNKKIILNTGKVARQAGGAVMLSCGETVILGTACAAPTASAEIDFFPLRVDYQEKFSSVGRTAAGFIKREGRPTEREILGCRLIDRPIRPMFEEGYYNEVQVLATVLSYDEVNTPDVLSICAASAALVLSEAPLVKPIGAVRVGMINGEFVINPSREELGNSKLDLVLAGTEDAVLMIEGYCDFLTEEQVLLAIETGHKEIAHFCQMLGKWADPKQGGVGKEKKRDTLRKISDEINNAVRTSVGALLEAALQIGGKQEREQAIANAKESLIKVLFPEGAEPKHSKVDVMMSFKNLQASIMRKRILETKKRIDGRRLDEIRPIAIENAILPRTHGSSLFTRGETQSIAVCTLGGETSGQRFEDLHGEGLQRFYLQYHFPPYSVGEVGRMGSPGRREIGHGKLAERALSAILPNQEEFPYVIRVESNITESNGSSSMASVCGGCLSMIDAGVPVKRPVSGIAMGLILEGTEFAILSDILGAEDSLGDMDFKVTGDEQGITAFQMDIKVEGITFDIMKSALAQAKMGRSHILRKMLPHCGKKEMSKHAPRIVSFAIEKSKIGTVIGPGGKMIRSIIEEFGVQVDINDDGIVSIASSDAEAMQKAETKIRGLVEEAKIGTVYHGTVVGIKDFGYFVEILPGKEGLCHISEISHQRLASMHDAPFKMGDKIDVKVLDIDPSGKIKLSHKALLGQPAHR